MVELRHASSEAAHPNVFEIARRELDLLRPVESISTAEVAREYRFMPAFGGGKVRFQPKKTPYTGAIHDAFDDVQKRLILVEGPARSGKTTSAEDYLLKVGKFGPARGVLWYMHSEPDLRRYVEERVEFFLREHEGLAEKVAGRQKRNKWNLKQIDGMTWEWLPANASTTRARSAALIVADEIDAMRPAIGDAITTLIRNRQREYGSLAKGFIASHPDRGPTHGIAKLLEDSDYRLRYWACPECAHLISPNYQAPKERRVTWNVAALMDEAGDDMTRDELIEYVASRVALICPHCKARIDNDTRLDLDAAGEWIGKGQSIDEHENVVGELIKHDTAGFSIHAFMSPFVRLDELVREYVAAYLNFRDDGSDELLRQVNVKSLGEVHVDPDDEAAKQRDWKETKAQHLDTGYKLATVPRGVDFLTMMVDVQGNRFEAGVWGWSRYRECWLIDRFAIKQRLGLKDINPGENIDDWDVLETALAFTYPLNDGTGRHLGIAKMAVDTGGVPGVTNNARIWASNLLASGRAEAWRIMLSKGEKDMAGELYGRVNKIREDDGGRELAVVVNERIVNVSAIKRIMSRRLGIDQPGPGFIHLPQDVEDRHVKELVSETFTNGVWLRRGANETWDTLIMCEVARALLAPDSAEIDWIKNPPAFASPFIPSQKAKDGDTTPGEVDFFDRLSKLNRGRKTTR